MKRLGWAGGAGAHRAEWCGGDHARHTASEAAGGTGSKAKHAHEWSALVNNEYFKVVGRETELGGRESKGPILKASRR